MTKAELLALTYNDIDLEKRTISVNKAYQRIEGRDIITPPKTPKSKRIITIPPFLTEELKEYTSHLYGKLTIVQGDPGDGKTTFILNIAAKLSKGESLDGGMNFIEPLNVIYQSAEDGLADTVKPRLEQAKADCEKISVIDEQIKSLSMIDERLEQVVIKTGAKLLILDPIQAYLGGGMDYEQIQQVGLANEARDMTKKLAALAEKYQCAIVLEADWNNRLGHNEQCGQSSHQRQEIKRHIEEWGRLISLQSQEAFS